MLHLSYIYFIDIKYIKAFLINYLLITLIAFIYILYTIKIFHFN